MSRVVDLTIPTDKRTKDAFPFFDCHNFIYLIIVMLATTGSAASLQLVANLCSFPHLEVIKHKSYRCKGNDIRGLVFHRISFRVNINTIKRLSGRILVYFIYHWGLAPVILWWYTWDNYMR